MSDKFVASNGTKVQVTEDGHMELREVPAVPGWLMIDRDVVADLREFFLHERDQELGRWRWPDDPRYLVYKVDEDQVRVTFEPSGISIVARLSDLSEAQSVEFTGAAKAYAAAHPEPRSWHDAADGQLWLIRFSDFPDVDVSALVKGGLFLYNDHCHEGVAPLYDSTIVAARRIWPEVSDAS